MSYCTILCLSNYFYHWIIAQMYVLQKKIMKMRKTHFSEKRHSMGQKSIRHWWEFGEEGFKMPEIALFKRNFDFSSCILLFFVFPRLAANFNCNSPDVAWSVCPLMKGVYNNCSFLRAFFMRYLNQFFAVLYFRYVN